MTELDEIQKHQPQNVRLVLLNGSEISVETAFVGIEEDTFKFIVVLPDDFDEDIRSIKVALFPSKTALGFPPLYGM